MLIHFVRRRTLGSAVTVSLYEIDFDSFEASFEMKR